MSFALFAQASGAALSLLFVPLSARTLGLDAFGLVGLAAVVQFLVFVLDGCNAMTRLVARECAAVASDDRIPTAASLMFTGERAYWVICAIGPVVGVLVAAPLSEHYRETSQLRVEVIAQAIVLIFAGAFLKLLASFYRGCLVGLQEFTATNGIALASNLLRFPGAFAATLLVADVRVFLLVQFSSFALEALALRGRFGNCALGRACASRREWARTIFSRERPFLAAVVVLSAISAASNQFDKLILATSLPLPDYGVVSLAILVCSGLFVLATPVHQVFLPRLTAARKNDSTDGGATQLLATLLVVTVPSSVTLAACSPSLAALVAPSQLADLAALDKAFLLYGLGNCVGVMSTGLYLVYFSAGQLQRYTVVLTAYVAGYAPVAYAATLSAGVAGAGSTWLGGNLVLTIILLGDLAYRHIVSRHFTALALYGLGTGCALSIAAAALRSFAPTSPVGATAAVLGIFAAALIATVLALLPILRSEERV